MSFRIQTERSAATEIRPATEAPPTAGSPSERASRDEGPSPFAKLLAGLGDEARRGESATRAAVVAGAAGRDPSPTELLALQSQVYRYSEVIDLSAKLVDRASNGVKTVITGQ